MKNRYFLIAFLIALTGVISLSAGTLRRMTALSDVTALGDGDTGNTARVVGDGIMLGGGDKMAYQWGTESIITEACIVSAITFAADTAGDNIKIYDGLYRSDDLEDYLKLNLKEGLANNSKTITFPAGLKFNTEVYVDMDAGCEVYFAYSAL